MKSLHLLVPFILLAGLSCGKVSENTPGMHSEGVKVAFSLKLENPPCRSSFCPDEQDKLSDINVWVYQEGFLLPDYSFYQAMPENGQLEISFPSVNAEYNVYFFANAGQVPGPSVERDIGDACATLDGYDSFIEKGFPMAGAISGFSPSESACVSLSRLVGRFDISACDNPSNDKVSYTFLSAKMKACARTIRPFGSVDGMNGYASRALSTQDILSDGDCLSAADIATLNSGGSVTLYYLENCQGTLLPENTVQHGKSAAAITSATGDSNLANLCSYLEITCSASTPTADYSSIIYRAYLGRDATTDFSVERNTFHSLSLDMASTFIKAEEWFVESASPNIRAHILPDSYLFIEETSNLNADKLGWNHSSCPDCGAAWGSSDFNLQQNGSGDYAPTCSCGWSGSPYSISESFSGTDLYLYDFLEAKIYVGSDLEYGDSYSAYFSSSGSSSGNGFSLSRTKYCEAIDCIRISDSNTTDAYSTTGGAILDTLVLESYDGLIRHEFPIHGITHAIPLGFSPLGYSSSTPGIRVYFGDTPSYSNGNPAGIRFRFSLNEQTMWVSGGSTYSTASDVDFTCNAHYDIPLILPSNYVRIYWGNIGTVSSGYSGPYGYLQGYLDLKGASVGPPYYFTDSAKKIKMGINSSTDITETSFSGGGVFDGKPYDSSSKMFSVNLFATATGYNSLSGSATSTGEVWTMFKLRSTRDGSLVSLRSLSSGTRYWSYSE